MEHIFFMITDTFWVSFRVGQTNLSAWVLALAVSLAAFFLIGLGWGLLWNRKWSVFGHLGWASFSILFALIAGTAALAWKGAEQTIYVVAGNRDTLADRLNASGVMNREILRAAWGPLQGSQDGLTPPNEGGNELRLRNSEDVTVLATLAATAARQKLSKEGIFAMGVPLGGLNPATVGQQTSEAFATQAFPIVVSPDNEISKTAVRMEVNAALESAQRGFRAPSEDLRYYLFWLMAVVILILALLTPIAALNDIREYPEV